MVRYAGLFCNRWKGQYLSQARIALNQFEPEDSDKNIQLSWTERQKEYTGVDPLIQTLRLSVFDHYSNIPTFHYSMWVARK